MLIRPATSMDEASIDAIYARSVVALLFQFETEQPSVSDMALRIEVNIEAYKCFMA